MIRISLALFTIATLVSFGWSQRREYGTLPPNSFGRLEQDPDYRPRGDVFVEGDLEMYVARPGQAGLGNKYVVWGHDIFGWQSGHTMQLVDRLAADTEYTVILPNLFRGEQWPPPPSFQWELSLQVLCDNAKMNTVCDQENYVPVRLVRQNSSVHHQRRS